MSFYTRCAYPNDKTGERQTGRMYIETVVDMVMIPNSCKPLYAS